jgi:hypothetical protein
MLRVSLRAVFRASRHTALSARLHTRTTGGALKKVLLGLLLLVIAAVGLGPLIAGLFGVNISYSELPKLIGINTTEKKEAVKNALLEGEIPKSFDAAKCDELLDLNKFPDTTFNGKAYAGGKSADVVFKAGQARLKGDFVELQLFSSESRASCSPTKADGSAPDDVTLTVQLEKKRFDEKAAAAAFTFGWDMAGAQPLTYEYSAGGASVKEPLAGLVGGLSLEAKPGGAVKGKAILCFAHPDPNAPPPAKPADYEEGDPLPPAGLRYAMAGNFTAEFCP